MKKVININFQGRVIPIEETAFELLKQYIESLRRYFANEEGREEIINDIQDRIGELFNDCLKGGATCVTDADLGKIIDNMGRPEDFEAAENAFAEQVHPGSGAGSSTGTAGPGKTGSTGGTGTGPTDKASAGRTEGPHESRGRLYRNDADKVLGGVCSGLANYLKIDPVIIRILLVIMIFGSFGAAVLVYFVLWVVLPAQGMETNIRKRLFRNPDDRMIGGVCGGIAAYFNIEVWIPRLIFAAPFLLGVLGAIFRVAFWRFSDFPIVFNGFGGSLLVVYIILWAVLPEARTASERLEMRGAKIDLESIKQSVQEEIQGLKQRAEKAGTEFTEKAKEWGEELKSGSRRFAKEAAPAARNSGFGVFRAIGILFKVFFLFLAGIIAFALLVALIAVLFGTIGPFTLSTIFFSGFWEHFFLWATLCLFLGIPVIALFHWIIRMIIGRRSQTNYIRYIFGTLWILGLVSVICLAGSFFRGRRTSGIVETEMSIAQPSHGRFIVKVKPGNEVEDSWNWGVQLNGFMDDEGDSILVSMVKLNVSKSADANYHVRTVKYSRGSSSAGATANAQRVGYFASQDDSILLLPKGFILNIDDHYHFQAVRVNVQVPVGGHIFLDESIGDLQGYYVGDFSGRDFWNNNNNWGNDWNWETGIDYIMTKNGLARADGKKIERNDEEDNSDNGDADDNAKPEHPRTKDTSGNAHQYRYHETAPAKGAEKPAAPAPKVDTAKQGLHAYIEPRKAAMPDADNAASPFYQMRTAG
jgi:phage shock protein PspC (stress-responsive transcriptional regulator)